jgi:hypothetical protein
MNGVTSLLVDSAILALMARLVLLTQRDKKQKELYTFVRVFYYVGIAGAAISIAVMVVGFLVR